MASTASARAVVGLVTCPHPTVASSALAVEVERAAARRGLEVRLVQASSDRRLPAALLRDVAAWHGVVTISGTGSPRPPATGRRRVVLDAVPSDSGWLRTRVAHVVPDDAAAARHLGRALAAQVHGVVAVAAVGGESDVAHRWVAGLRPALGRHGAVSLAWSATLDGATERLERLLRPASGRRPSAVVALSDETAAGAHTLLRDVGLKERVRLITRTAIGGDGAWSAPLPVAAMAERAIAVLGPGVVGGESPCSVTAVPFDLAPVVGVRTVAPAR